MWLATTDADTLVPADWLVRHLRHAAAGWDAVVGTVTVTDWADHPPEVPPLFYEHYATARGTHSHVHGANLGFRAEAYLAAGGFSPSPTAEDHALVDALTAAGQTGPAHHRGQRGDLGAAPRTGTARVQPPAVHPGHGPAGPGGPARPVSGGGGIASASEARGR